MKYFLNLVLSIVIAAAGFGQDSIKYRVILIGTDGVQANKIPKALQHITGNIIGGKTSVFFLDESNYLRGKVQPGSVKEKTAEKRLQSQYRPMRAKGARVFFI